MAIKRDQADIWFSRAVRHRDKHTCQYCGQEGSDCAHIYGRKTKSTRWSMDNAICLCRYHHRWFGENPLEFHRWLEMHYGVGHMEILRDKWNTTLKTNAALRAEISKHYREEFRKAEQDPQYEIVSYN